MNNPTPRQSIAHVPLDRLLAHPANIREDLGDLTDMAQSIREHGILQPLTATEHPQDGHLLLLAGHRRLAAACLAGLDVLPVIIRHNVTSIDDQLILMLVENTQRADLNPMDRAEAYGALRNTGLSISDIARRVGSTPSTISYYLNLLMLDDDERAEVRSGERKVGDAVAQGREARQPKPTPEQPEPPRPRGRPKGKKTKPYFGDTHPLAKTARAACRCTGRPKVGAVACGPCWERAIRENQDTRNENREATC